MIAPMIRFQRFVSKDADGCWRWTGNKLPKGYGVFSIRGKLIYAHRWIYQEKFRPLLPGEVVMHLCDQPSCVNPAHLRAGTTADNVHDMVDKGRVTRYNAAKTHCKHGHEFTPANTLIQVRTKTGRERRMCLTCRRRDDLARYHRRQGALLGAEAKLQ